MKTFRPMLKGEIVAMGIRFSWYNEDKTIILVYFEQDWQWTDLYEMDRLTDDMLDSVNHKVCYVIDMRSTNGIPAGISLSKIRQVIGTTHPKSDLMVIVGMKPYVRVMVNTVIRALGKISARLISVATIEEAEALIAERLKELSIVPIN